MHAMVVCNQDLERVHLVALVPSQIPPPFFSYLPDPSRRVQRQQASLDHFQSLPLRAIPPCDGSAIRPWLAVSRREDLPQLLLQPP